jgi:hypothetical protein
MAELEQTARYEIAWQKAMWDGDYAKAYEAARKVLGKLGDPQLRGYRALWHYLAGSAAQQAIADGEASLDAAARAQFRQAKEASSGITWLVGLARGTGAVAVPEDRGQATRMAQIERLEGYLHKLGTLHNRGFSARECAIRDGLASGEDFEAAQVLLGEHLGFEAGKRKTDAAPDPWWRIGEVTLVFEDHANAAPGSTLDATKARQAASHPDWVREHVPGAGGGEILSVLVTPVITAKTGAVPHLGHFAYWNIEDFRRWADAALVAVRELRHTFVEPGDLAWRAEAAERLETVRADAPTLLVWLSSRPAREFLTPVK